MLVSKDRARALEAQLSHRQPADNTPGLAGGPDSAAGGVYRRTLTQ
jgi:hypothetical protein